MGQERVGAWGGSSCLWYGISWSPEGLVALVMLARLVACCRCRTKFTQAVDNFLLQMQAPLGFSNKLSMNMGHASLLDQADILHFVCLSPVQEDHRLACNSRIVYHLAINSSGANLVNPTGRKPQSLNKCRRCQKRRGEISVKSPSVPTNLMAHM